MNTSERIRFVRGELTQQEFAEKLGVHKNSIGSYERGATKPDIEFLQAVCTAFHVEPRWLLFGDGPMSPSGISTGSSEPIRRVPQQSVQTCERCAKLEAKLEKIENQRDELAAENRKLWKENGDLREENATLRAQSREGQNALFDKTRKLSGTSEVMQGRP